MILPCMLTGFGMAWVGCVRRFFTFSANDALLQILEALVQFCIDCQPKLFLASFEREKWSKSNCFRNVSLFCLPSRFSGSSSGICGVL